MKPLSTYTHNIIHGTIYMIDFITELICTSLLVGSMQLTPTFSYPFWIPNDPLSTLTSATLHQLVGTSFTCEQWWRRLATSSLLWPSWLHPSDSNVSRDLTLHASGIDFSQWLATHQLPTCHLTNLLTSQWCSYGVFYNYFLLNCASQWAGSDSLHHKSVVIYIHHIFSPLT
jgi:hypothetical protein